MSRLALAPSCQRSAAGGSLDVPLPPASSSLTGRGVLGGGAGAAQAPFVASATSASRAQHPSIGHGSRFAGCTTGGSAAVAANGTQPVAAFLREAGLSQYAGTLLRNGFDDMETLMDIEDADMRELEIPSHHAVRLRRRLQDFRSLGASGDSVEDHPVVAFLREAGLCQYAHALLQSGFDDMETLAEIEDSDMKDLGIPRGYAVKLKKRLRERQGAPQGPPSTGAAPLQAQTPAPRFPVAVLTAPLRPLRGVACRPPAVDRRPARPLEDHERTAVERSWELVKAHGVLVVGELLYRHLFEITPKAVEFFPPEVRHRYCDWDALDDSVWESAALRKLFAKVVNAVGYAVAGLHDPTRLVPMLTQLGARHISYKVSPEHWEQLGEALNRTLRQLLGKDFTPEVEMAWSTVYNFIAAIMIQGLRSAQSARAGTAGGLVAEAGGPASPRSGGLSSQQGSDGPPSLASSAGALLPASPALKDDRDGGSGVPHPPLSIEPGDKAAGELPTLLARRSQHALSGKPGDSRARTGIL